MREGFVGLAVFAILLSGLSGLVIISPSASAQGDFVWIRQFGTSDLDSAVSVAVSASGVYVLGTTRGTIPGLTNAGGYDIFLRKYDAAGNEAWTRQFGTPSQDDAGAVAVGASGVYVVGTTGGTFPGQTSLGGQDGVIQKYDEDGNVVWTRQFGTSGNDHVHGVAVGTSGVYVACDTGGTFPGQTNRGGLDACLLKYDEAGNAVWTRQWGTSYYDYVSRVAAGASGVYLGSAASVAEGWDGLLHKYDENGTEAWALGVGSAIVSATAVRTVDLYVAGNSYPSAFAQKYDDDGNFQWGRWIDASDSPHASAVAVNASSVYLAGWVRGVIPGQTSAGGDDAFLQKYDENGNAAWTRQFGTSDGDSATDVAAGASGVYVVGTTSGTFPGQTSAGFADAFLIRLADTMQGTDTTKPRITITSPSPGAVLPYTSVTVSGTASDDVGLARVELSSDGTSWITASGTTVWSGQLTLAQGMHSISARASDTSGNTEITMVDVTVLLPYIWIREFVNASALRVAVNGSAIYIAGEVGGALPSQTSAGLADAFVRRYDRDGIEVWTRQFGSSGLDAAAGIAVSGSGVYVAGYTEGTLPGQTSAGNDDAFVRKYDLEGNEVWTRQFGSSLETYARAIAADASGVYVAGATYGALPGQTSAGYDHQDVFVRKYDFDGNEIWTRQYGSSSDDSAEGIAVDGSGVYVAGLTYGALPGQTYGGQTDAFLSKYDHDGNEIWTHQFGDSRDEQALGVGVDNGAVFVVGRMAPAGFLRKYDLAGSEVWTRQFGSSPGTSPEAVAVDESGVYLVGYTNEALSGQPLIGFDDAFIQKYDSEGTELWTRQFGTPQGDYAQGVAVDSAGVYVAGSFDEAEAFVARISKSAPYVDRPPVLTVPGPIVVEATGPSGARVEYIVTAQDDANGSVTLVCSPAAGSVFLIGTTTVTCIARDVSGNEATGSFTVEVRDTRPPLLTVPADLHVEATDSFGATVTFVVTAMDLVDPSPSVSCSPPSGSSFGIGTTSVTCTATDFAGNAATESFRVTVTARVERSGFALPMEAAAVIIGVGAIAVTIVALFRRRRKGRDPRDDQEDVP